MKKIIVIIAVSSTTALAHAPITQEQYDNMYNHGDFTGVGVIKKNACTAQEFIDELLMHKDDVGYVYTVDYIQSDKSYAIVNNYGQQIEVVYEEGTGPFPIHSYDGWGNAYLQYSHMVFEYFNPTGKRKIAEPILSDPYTDQTDLGRFTIDLKNKIKATFDTRMDCVKFDTYATAMTAQ